MHSFDDCIGPETLSREYKEFSLHKSGLPFDLSQAIYYCTTNKFDFDDLVVNTIPKYIDYIPKYACGFWNAGITDGELYIGIDDLGFIKGIPLSHHTSITAEWIKEIVIKKIKSHIRSDEGDFPIPISVFIEPINTPEKEEGIHPDFEKYIKKKKVYLESYNEFISLQKKWMQTYEYVNMKLIDIVNQPQHRKKLIEFMEQSPIRNERALYTIYDPNYLLPDVSGEGIVRDLKQDQSNVFYWVTTFKDELTIEYKKYKPVCIKPFKQRNVPFNLLIGMSDMIPYWVDQIKLFTIRITFGGQPTTRFRYFNGSEWIRCHRMINHNQPVCMPQ